MTGRDRAGADDGTARFARLPPVVPLAGVVAWSAVDELPFGGPEGGGDGD